ncbi:MAG: DUF2779 domain-containing protein [Deltaproteobacteria bacterium]|nr:DUF2779 domain-containing protein [Deltaproteobacteria bacterium]
MNSYLSKSKILSGLQCPKRLYLEVHNPELAEESDDQQKAFNYGNQVGEVARQLHSGGRMIEYDEGLSRALEETRLLLAQPSQALFYEATFSFSGVLVRADIFRQGDTGHRLIEVKAATEVKDHYLWDCAVQVWVIEGAGYPLERVELAHVDNSFIYPGNSEYQGLLAYQDLTATIRPYLDQIPGKVAEFRSLLQGEMPLIETGGHCDDPYPCPFWSYCSQGQPDPPEYPINALPYARGYLLEALKTDGIDDIRQIPEGYLSSDNHERVRRITVSGQPELEPGAGEYLRELTYPRYYLDFETIQFAVPIWAGTRPYQQLPFQFSCHIEAQPGELTHTWFLDTSGQSPSRSLAERLLAVLGDSGPIFSYGHYEKTIINSLMAMFPDLAENLGGLLARIEDLLPLTRRHYYHQQMKGTWSLKAVLPTIAPDLDYESLDEVQDGGSAQLAYAEAIDPATPPERRQELSEKLLAYCRMDTLGLVRLVTFFQVAPGPVPHP